MTTTTGPELVRRGRAALAEIGVDPALIETDRDGNGQWDPRTLDPEVAWRARCAAGKHTCLACWQWAIERSTVRPGAYDWTTFRFALRDCTSSVAYTRDCGS
jgi:hypothetical protein